LGEERSDVLLDITLDTHLPLPVGIHDAVDSIIYCNPLQLRPAQNNRMTRLAEVQEYPSKFDLDIWRAAIPDRSYDDFENSNGSRRLHFPKQKSIAAGG
jgi:hypothetical protein